MSYFSCVYYGFPSKELDVVGVTGTNGKTTTTEIITEILNTAGIATQSIGTLTEYLRHLKRLTCKGNSDPWLMMEFSQ